MKTNISFIIGNLSRIRSWLNQSESWKGLFCKPPVEHAQRLDVHGLNLVNLHWESIYFL